jgi:putative peptidoglycan lipid II flippase
VSVDGGGHRSGRHSDRAIFRQSGLTGIAAGAGLIAGLILDISIAFRFGAGPNTDSFFVAGRIAIGLAAVVTAAANQALVPAFRTSLTQRGERSTDRLISMVVAIVLIVGAALVLLTWLLASPLVHVTAPGLKPATDYPLAASMVPVMFAEVMRAYLNARFAFVAPALMTVVLNGLAAAMIIVLPIVGWRGDVHLVAYAFLAGAAAQAVFMYAMAVRQGLRVRPVLDLADEQLRSLGRLCVRPLGAGGLNPVARTGEQFMVSFLPPGSITVLNYGFLVISAVGGTVFFRSVIVALIPRITDAHNRDGQAEVRRYTALGIRIMLAISVPLTAFMAVLGKPAAIAVFYRGKFLLPAAELLGTVLIVYSVALVGSAVQRALLAPFYARLDTRAPLRNAFYGVLANMVLLPLLVLPLGLKHQYAIVGVALAYSLAQYVNVAHAWYRLNKIDGNPGEGVLPFAVKLLLASIVSAAVMIGAGLALNLYDPHLDRIQLLIRTPVDGLLGLGVLLAVLYLLAGGEIKSWGSLLRRRRPPAGGGDASVTIGLDDPTNGPPTDGSSADDGPRSETEAVVESAPIAANLP